MDAFDDDFAEEVQELDQGELELEKLESRLEKVREPKRGGNKKFAQGVALVMSLGFVVAGCLYGGVILGDYFTARTGSDSYKTLGLITGLMLALFSAVKLLQPLMKSED